MKYKDLISSIRKLSVDLSNIADALEGSAQPAPAQALSASTAQTLPVTPIDPIADPTTESHERSG